MLCSWVAISNYKIGYKFYQLAISIDSDWNVTVVFTSQSKSSKYFRLV